MGDAAPFSGPLRAPTSNPNLRPERAGSLFPRVIPFSLDISAKRVKHAPEDGKRGTVLDGYYRPYLRRYRQLRPFAAEQMDAWKIAVVAARLTGAKDMLFRGERRRLTDYIERSRSSPFP